MGKSCRRPLHAGRRPLRVLVRGRRRPLLLLVLRSPNAPCCAAACAHGGSHSMSRVLRACMELRVSPARHGSGHMHATSSPPVVQPDNHMPRSFTARRTSMNACEANVVEALLHQRSERPAPCLAVSCHSRRGHGGDGMMVAPQSLSSVPIWIQPHAALSTGEAFRSELAWRLQWAVWPLAIWTPSATTSTRSRPRAAPHRSHTTRAPARTQCSRAPTRASCPCRALGPTRVPKYAQGRVPRGVRARRPCSHMLARLTWKGYAPRPGYPARPAYFVSVTYHLW